MAKPKKSFETWMAEVDVWVGKLAGLSAHDLPDYCYRDAYDDGRLPLAVAKSAIKAAKE